MQTARRTSIIKCANADTFSARSTLVPTNNNFRPEITSGMNNMFKSGRGVDVKKGSVVT